MPTEYDKKNIEHRNILEGPRANKIGGAAWNPERQRMVRKRKAYKERKKKREVRRGLKNLERGMKG